MANATAARQRWLQTSSGEMVKSAAFFLLLLSLAVFIYFAYRSYALRQRNEGDVTGESQETTPADDGNRSGANRHLPDATRHRSHSP